MEPCPGGRGDSPKMEDPLLLLFYLQKRKLKKKINKK
jgi:hypothetical protein